MNNLAGAQDREEEAKTHYFRLRTVKPLHESFGFQSAPLAKLRHRYARPIEPV
jgi:hypothetical protein